MPVKSPAALKRKLRNDDIRDFFDDSDEEDAKRRKSETEWVICAKKLERTPPQTKRLLRTPTKSNTSRDVANTRKSSTAGRRRSTRSCVSVTPIKLRKLFDVPFDIENVIIPDEENTEVASDKKLESVNKKTPTRLKNEADLTTSPSNSRKSVRSVKKSLRFIEEHEYEDYNPVKWERSKDATSLTNKNKVDDSPAKLTTSSAKGISTKTTSKKGTPAKTAEVAKITPNKMKEITTKAKTSKCHAEKVQVCSIKMTPKKQPVRKTKEIVVRKTPIKATKLKNAVPEVADVGISFPRERFLKAMNHLREYNADDVLPCREKEFDDIYNFVINKITLKSGGCMYISGMPGLGKTETVLCVERKLRRELQNGQIPSFKFLKINGVEMRPLKSAYSIIWSQLTGNSWAPDRAQKALSEKFIQNSNHTATILLIDEFDRMCVGRQKVIYNILDWATHENSGLVIIGISNVMDLAERTLKDRNTSRMGLTRLVFRDYSYQQLMQIMKTRLGEYADVFHPDAIQLIARKEAGVCGDVRRAIGICSMTVDMATESGTSRITVPFVQKAVERKFTSAAVPLVRSCNTLGKLMLRALRDEFMRTDADKGTLLAGIYDQFEAICTLEGLKVPTLQEAHIICSSLINCRLVLTTGNDYSVNRSLFLNVTWDDIYYALNFDEN